MRSLLAVTLSVVLALHTLPAAADPANLAAAQALFEQGKALVAQGDHARAAAKFEESQKLDPGAGTLLQLARCYENLGRTASAWATYHEAASLASQGGRKDWQALARQRVAALEPKLSHLTVRTDEPALDLVVKRNGTDVPRALFNSRIPVDPGAVHIVASARGRQPYMADVRVEGAGDFTATIPKLEPAPPAPPAVGVPAATAPAPGVVTARKRIERSSTGGIVLLAVGGAAVAGGAVFGLLALDADGTSKDRCPEPRCTDREGVDANDRARTMGTLSTVFVIAGAAVAAGGAGFLLLRSSKSTAWIAPSVGPGSGFVALRGSFR